MNPKKLSPTASAVGKNSRRTFIKNSATLAALVAAGPLVKMSAFAANKSSKELMNGLQVGMASFADEGVDTVLDILQKRGAINTIFLNTFTYGDGL
ncbi:MAG: twin-arginine translocation signal domain-containing protein, partial [Mucilaginibacter sp.]|nr:twin-arginine translocation signal domain-containing protein [Mucilaginibacter sp.]